LYGKAEFRGSFSEPEDTPAIPSTPTTSTIAPPSTSKPSTHVESEYDNLSEGYSVLQKGLFFFAILGCIVVYLRMNKKKDKRYREKSMV